MRLIPVRALLSIALLAALAAACGDNEAAPTVAGTTAPPEAPTKPPGGGRLPETSSPACVPVNAGSKADTTVDVRLQEWAVIPSVSQVKSGSIHFRLDNVGEDAHEFIAAKGDDPNKLPTDADGAVVLPEERFTGEVEPFPGGQKCEGTFNFEPGKYVLFCNRVDEENGKKEVHYKLGMRTSFTVT